MPFDELEWVRANIDRWLADNGTTLALAVSLTLVIASVMAG